MEPKNRKVAFVLLGAALLAWMLWPSDAKAQPAALPPSPTPPPPPPAVPDSTRYTVVSGDSLSLIAARVYGDGTIGKKDAGWKWWPHLWDLNKGVIGCNWNALRIGMVLSIPSAQSLPVERQVDIFLRAPNWKNPPKSC